MRISDWSSDVCSSDLSDQSDGHGLHARFLTDLGTEGHLIAGRQRNLLTMVEAARGNIDIVAADRLQRLCEDDSLVRRESAFHPVGRRKIGRASCRERVCQYV